MDKCCQIQGNPRMSRKTQMENAGMSLEKSALKRRREREAPARMGRDGGAGS